jgi:rhamnogalacturonyl hydrolase YesR
MTETEHMAENENKTDKKSAEKVCAELVSESIRQLDDIMKVPFKRRLKDRVKGVLGRATRVKDPMFWPAGMLMLGLVEARRTDAGAVDSAVLRHLKLWEDRYASKVGYIDDALAGAALLRLYKKALRDGKDSHSRDLAGECKKAADRIYEYLKRSPKDEDGVLVYNAAKSNNIFADGVGQSAMFLSLYGSCFDNRQALEMAGVQLRGFFKNGMDNRTGLPYHGYLKREDGTVEKKGVLCWGRAAGWLIMGLSEYACAAENDVELSNRYVELSEALLTYMRPDGGYSWQVQATQGHLDTSATGMILYGLIRGGALSEGQESRKLLLDCAQNGRVKDALSACEDFGVHYQTYGEYPWGQGAVLAALALISGV